MAVTSAFWYRALSIVCNAPVVGGGAWTSMTRVPYRLQVDQETYNGDAACGYGSYERCLNFRPDARTRYDVSKFAACVSGLAFGLALAVRTAGTAHGPNLIFTTQIEEGEKAGGRLDENYD